MESLFKAIYAKFAGNAALVAALTGGMRLAKVNDRVVPPYATYDLISNSPEWTFAKTLEKPLIQFSIVAADLATLNDCAKKLIVCFDFATLSFTGSDYTTVGLIRENQNQMVVGDYFQYIIDYRVMICEV